MAGQEGERESDNGGEIATEEQHLDEEQRKRKRFRWRRRDGVDVEVPLPFGLSLSGAGAIGILIVLVIGLVAYLLWPKSQSQSQVPSLIGMPRAMAEEQLKSAGLSLRAIYDEVSDQPVGTVLRSDPAVGTKLDQGAGVSLSIAVARPIPSPSDSILIQIPGNSVPAPGYPPPPPGNIFLPPSNTIVVVPPNGSPPAASPTPPPSPILTPSPIPTPSPLPMVSLGSGRVKHPDSEYDDCSTGYRFKFFQEVSMAQPGRVTYRWLRSVQVGASSNRVSAPVEDFIDFSSPGTQIVTTWWEISGQPGDQLTGWQQIEILAPVHLAGQRISFSYTCPEEPL